MLKELKQRREAQLYLLEPLVRARNGGGVGFDHVIRDIRKKVAKISLKIFKIKGSKNG